MGTTVRNLTDAEKATLAPLLDEIHGHTDGCAVCQVAMTTDEKCARGRELQAAWEEWLAAR